MAKYLLLFVNGQILNSHSVLGHIVGKLQARANRLRPVLLEAFHDNFVFPDSDLGKGWRRRSTELLTAAVLQYFYSRYYLNGPYHFPLAVPT